MNSETKIYQNCKTDFTIEPEDFAFYEKIKVPPPTFCPRCRLQRRLFGGVFETKYPKEETPCIFCKKCYRAEVV